MPSDPSPSRPDNVLANAAPDVLFAALAQAKAATEAQPGDVTALIDLSAVQLRMGQHMEATASVLEALRLNPESAPARNLQGDIRAAVRRLNEDIVRYQRAPGREANAKTLECIYALNQQPEFARFLAKFAAADPTNIRAAAVAAFAAQQWGTDNAYPFCRDPLEFIAVEDVSAALGPWSSFTAELAREMTGDEAVWEPGARTTRRGFQSLGNLFDLKGQVLARLEKLLRERIAAYAARFAGAPDGFISRWPKSYGLSAWQVRLMKGGHQMAHIHPTGWLSGVLYLGVPEAMPGDEGAIEFSLHGYNYPLRNHAIPRRLHHPKAGELVLFPSCLFHRTIPFSSAEERHSLAFDLQPA